MHLIPRVQDQPLQRDTLSDMETRLMVVMVVFACVVCHYTEAQFLPTSPLNTSITRTSCGVTKLCVSAPSNCDPAGTSRCFFSSAQFSTNTLAVEISGMPATGYVALASVPTNNFTQQLTPATVVFVCGNNNSINSSFFEVATQNTSGLTPVESPVSISTVQALLNSSTSLIQCAFNISLNPSLFTGSTPLPYNISILQGTTNGTNLGGPTVIISKGPFDLTNPKSNIVSLNINRTGCGNTKLCVSSVSNCNLTGNTNCFFSSVQAKDQTFFFELSGTTSGYVALGLTKGVTMVVFVCGNNTSLADYFFDTAMKIGTSLVLANVNTVYSNQGLLSQNPSVIQCIFNTSTSFNTSARADDTNYAISIMSGTTNGTKLGDPTTQFDSAGSLNLSNPAALNSNNSAVGLWTQVMPVLFSALTLHLL